MHQIRFPASIRPSVRLLDTAWYFKVRIKHYNIIRCVIYSMRDLLSDLNNYAWPAKRYVSDTVNDVNAPCGISSP